MAKPPEDPPNRVDPIDMRNSLRIKEILVRLARIEAKLDALARGELTADEANALASMPFKARREYALARSHDVEARRDRRRPERPGERE